MIRHSLAATLLARAFRRHRRNAQLHRIVRSGRLHRYGDHDAVQGELRARDLLRRAESAAPWIPSPLYPIGGAAGPLLSYLILRALTELPFESVLELGAGQSTRLIAAWARSGRGRTVTFEEDRSWAERIGGEVNSDSSAVFHLPLREYSTPERAFAWYSPPPPHALPDGGFDLVIVDGPVGTSPLSRYGIVERIPEWLADDWALVWDDLDRPADLRSFALLIRRLRERGVNHDHRLLDGDRIVGIVFTPKFSAMRYMW